MTDRRQCPYCGRLVALRKNGTLREHGMTTGSSESCAGSGEPTEPDSSLVLTQDDEDVPWSPYKRATEEQSGVLALALSSYHERLLEANVTIALVAKHAKLDAEGMPRGPALKHHGVPALGVVRINSIKHRVQGLPDVEIVIDGDRWAELNARQQLALLDHELTHVEIVLDEDGETIEDEAHRPKLKLRPHDREMGLFDEVAERHGDDSIERQHIQRLIDERGQLYFGWTYPLTPPPPPQKRSKTEARAAEMGGRA